MSDPRGYYRGRRVLITGGLGFLGSNLAHALADAGAQVAILDAMLPLYGGNLHNLDRIEDRVQVTVADLRDDAAVRHAVTGREIIFHIAAQTSHVDSMTDPLLDVDINCRGNILFLEAVRALAPAARVVFAGTRGQYGRLAYTPVDERHKMEPVDIYGVDKAAAEQYHFIYHRAYGLWVTSLRINNSYGPRHQMRHGKYGILNWFVRLAMDGGAIKVFGDGRQVRDYNYVDDVTDAFLRAGATDGCNGQAYNLGSGEPVPFLDMVKAVIAAAGSGSYRQVPWPKDRADIEVGDYVADFSKFTKATGWTPAVGLAEGLTRTVAFYRERQPYYWDPAPAPAAI